NSWSDTVSRPPQLFPFWKQLNPRSVRRIQRYFSDAWKWPLSVPRTALPFLPVLARGFPERAGFPPALLHFRSCKRGFLWFHTGSVPVPRSFLVTSIRPVLSPALVDIVLIFAPWAAKGGVGPTAQEHLLAVLAQAQGLVTVHQHEAEHHLDTQQQGVKIPVNGGLIQQLNVVCGGNPAKCGHSLAVQPPFVLAHEIIVIVVETGGGQRKGPVLELVSNPLAGFRIFPLEAHVFRHRLVHEGDGQGNHRPVTGYIPGGFNALLHHIQLVKG